MRKFIMTLASFAIAITHFSGCAVSETAQSQTPEREAASSCPFFSKKMLEGAIVGGVMGGVAASATSTNRSTSDILKSIVAGAVAGGAIGKILDTKDCDAARVAMQQMGTTHVGKPIAWRNPESGNRGTFVAKSAAVHSANGQLCRSYHQTVILKDGTSKEQDGTTCRDGNGDWYPLG